MKKILLIALVGILAFACNKDQQAVKKLDGTWKAQFYYVTEDGEKSDNLAASPDSFSFTMTFESCKLKNDEFCSASSTTTFDGESETTSFLYRVINDGTVMELKEVGSLFVQEINIDYLSKDLMELNWVIEGEDMSFEVDLKKQ
jgi:hypothetical protein